MHSSYTFCFYILPLILAFGTECAVGAYSIRIDEGISLEKHNSNVTCVVCDAGSFSGSFSVDGKPYNCSAYCTLGSCPIGINCTLCPTGTYNTQPNSTECLSCGEGSVSPMGSTNCTQCDAGFTTNHDSSRCIPCTPGTYNPNPGSTCLLCPQGQYTNISGSTGCIDCEPGSYNPQFGEPVCFACGRGRYNPSEGSVSISACLTCPGGYYCPSAFTAIPEICPANNYCPAGSNQPTACQFLFQSDRSSENCQPKSTLYLLLLGGVGILVVVVSVIVCVRAGSKKRLGPESKTKAPTEADRLIPEPRDGPVYEGL